MNHGFLSAILIGLTPTILCTRKGDVNTNENKLIVKNIVEQLINYCQTQKHSTDIACHCYPAGDKDDGDKILVRITIKP